MNYTRNGKTYELPIIDQDLVNEGLEALATGYGVPQTSVAYLLAYGFKQSLQDSAAQPAVEAKDESEPKVKLGEMTAEDAAKSVADAIDGAMSKRLDKIKSGDVAMRGGAGRVSDPFESAVRDVIDEILAKSAKKNGKKVPKGDELIAMRAKVREAHKDAVESEARKRLEATTKLDIDVSL